MGKAAEWPQMFVRWPLLPARPWPELPQHFTPFHPSAPKPSLAPHCQQDQVHTTQAIVHAL